ncbi:methyl-accepting chemotaxis protein [Aeromonas simiae]|uniref:methyl-accepting chemotaxis protein n=1 Tax=Aeromonas simiae TaxID=218936 RepID=UPI00266B9E69|nr:methyl-accepting chemotaxis protein [Aeromonas simiae]MDO2949147.1 methyl-accepting chemotaxis protein [Aeromonas simiae]MDO2952664.1 methyl-accepting chemotaxis protein [Aeromonas simiae]MDO2956365.1 methyl-accepting chemotaxis protein [Aeromonas simiae]
MSFRAKIHLLLLLAVLITVATSYLSVNHFISGYIRQQAEQNIASQVALVREKLEGDINQKILLAGNLNFGVTNVKKTLEETGFHNIVKQIGDMAFDRDGVINDPKRVDALRSEAAKAGGKVQVSPLQTVDGKPVVVILVPRGADSAYFYYLDMTEFRSLLEKSAGDGKRFELKDAAGHLLISQPAGGETIAKSFPIDVHGSAWSLTGYVDLDYIAGLTRDINGKITFALLLVGLVVLAVSLVALKLAYRPIPLLRDLVLELSRGSGDLTRRLSVTSRDDLGQISGGINDFIARLQEMMLAVSEAAERLNGGIEAVAGQSRTARSLLERHAGETGQVVTAITEMSSAAGSVAENAAATAQLAGQSRQLADQSRQVVDGAMASVSALVGEVEETARSVLAMQQDVERIGAVLGVIGGIAEQTNLLALNAAIEAARAGEQGRGFAVVADEVRALAGRTQQSTAEIRDMLERLQRGSQTVVAAMEGTKESCRETADKTARVHGSLDQVVDAVVRSNDLVSQIATAAEQQSLVADEISRNMHAIAEVVSQLERSGEEVAAGAGTMEQSYRALRDIVGRFRLH